MANRGGGHSQSSYGGHQNVQQSHQHQRSYQHSNRAPANPSYTQQTRINLSNQATPNLTSNVASNQNQNIALGHRGMAASNMISQPMHGAHQVSFYPSNPMMGHQVYRYGHSNVYFPYAYNPISGQIIGPPTSSPNPSFQMTATGVPNNSENATFTSDIPQFPPQTHHNTPSPAQPPVPLPRREKVRALLQDPDTLEKLDLETLAKTDLPVKSTTTPTKETSEETKTEVSSLVLENSETASDKASANPIQQEFMDKISGAALNTSDKDQSIIISATDRTSNKSTEHKFNEPRENDASKPSDSCLSETQASQINSSRNELKQSDGLNQSDAKKSDNSDALFKEEKKSPSQTGDHTVISPSEKVPSTVGQSAVQAVSCKTITPVDAAKHSQSTSSDSVGDKHKEVKSRREEDKSFVNTGGSRCLPPPSEITSLNDTLTQSHFLDQSIPNVTFTNSKLSSDTGQGDTGNTRATKSTHKDAIQLNEKELSLSKTSDGNKSATASQNILSGKKKYDPDFLKSLRTSKLACVKPNLKPNPGGPFVYDQPVHDRPETPTTANFLPQYLQKALTNNDRQPSRSRGNRGMDKHPYQDKRKIIIDPSISMNQNDIELHKVENAWKPGIIKGDEADLDKEDRTTEDLLRRFRGILNKLTPQKFDDLIKHILSLQIDTKQRLDKILCLIFDKALNEPSFCVEYAKVCKHLSSLQIFVKEDELDSNEADKNAKAPAEFRRMLLQKCQDEYSSDMYKNIDLDSWTKKIEEADDPDKRKALEAELDEIKRKARKRWLGFIRFIGELYLHNLLSYLILCDCLHNLANTQDDESLECLCTLLKTIGSKFEDHMKELRVNEKRVKQKNYPVPDMDVFFGRLQSIIDLKPIYTSSRVRFMIQDILDMRRDGWKIRKVQNENKPKTHEELRREIKQEEEHNQQVLQASAKRKNMTRQEEWDNKLNTKGNSAPPSELLKSLGSIKDSMSSNSNITLAPPTQGTWNKGASAPKTAPQSEFSWGGSKKNDTSISSLSYYDSGRSNLRSSDNNKRDLSKGSLTGLSSRGYPSMSAPDRETSMNSNFIKTPSRGMLSSGQPFSSDVVKGSKEKTRSSADAVKVLENSKSRSQSLDRKPEEKINSISKDSVVEVKFKGSDDLDEDELKEKVKSSFKKYCTNRDPEAFVYDLTELCNENNVDKFINYAIEYTSSLHKPQRSALGELFCYLINKNVISIPQLIKEYRSFLEFESDMLLDIPALRAYLAEQLQPLFLAQDEKNRNSIFVELLEPIIKSGGAAEVVYHMVEPKAGDINLLRSVDWSLFLPPGTSVKDFLESRPKNLLVASNFSSAKTADTKCSADESESALCKYFLDAKDEEELINLVDSHLGRERKGSPEFARALTKAIVKKCLQSENSKEESLTLNDRLFDNFCTKVLTKYVSSLELQLEALYSFGDLLEELEPLEPARLLDSIFKKIYKDLSWNEALCEWSKNSDSKTQKVKNCVRGFLIEFNEGNNSDC